MADIDESLGSSPLVQVPIEVRVTVGRARPQVRELLKLKRDAVLPLDRHVDDPVELYVGDKLIARGEQMRQHRRRGHG